MAKTTYTIKADLNGQRYFESEDEDGVTPLPPGFSLELHPGHTTVDAQGHKLKEAQTLPLGTRVILILPPREEAKKLEAEAIRYTLETKARQILLNEGKRPTDEAVAELVEQVVQDMVNREAERPAILREGAPVGQDPLDYFRKAALALASAKHSK